MFSFELHVLSHSSLSFLLKLEKKFVLLNDTSTRFACDPYLIPGTITPRRHGRHLTAQVVGIVQVDARFRKSHISTTCQTTIPRANARFRKRQRGTHETHVSGSTAHQNLHSEQGSPSKAVQTLSTSSKKAGPTVKSILDLCAFLRHYSRVVARDLVRMTRFPQLPVYDTILQPRVK